MVHMREMEARLTKQLDEKHDAIMRALVQKTGEQAGGNPIRGEFEFVKEADSSLKYNGVVKTKDGPGNISR